MLSDQEVHNTISKITDTKNLFSMSGFSFKESPYKDVKKKRGATSPKAEIIEQLCKFMGEDNTRFAYWCGRTRKLTPSQIYELMQKAKNGNNKPALFNWLLKNNK